jgi:NAD(P)-dependent dehydrogenase (short-subunit alcohol dehydrogenase family)
MSKKVTITGVSRGLGRAMVAEFIRLGWTVSGCCRNAHAVEQLRAEYGGSHFFQQTDVTKESEVLSFCEQVISKYGAPDLLLNNAAIVNKNAPLWEVSAEEFSDVMDVNIKGTAAMIRNLVPAMLKSGNGVVVNFSSGWGRSTSPEVAPYCATKWAIEGLSQAMSQETGGKVAVVALNPGIIDTEMLRSCFGEGAGGFPDAEDWAKRAVPFLINLGAKDNGRALSIG